MLAEILIITILLFDRRQKYYRNRSKRETKIKFRRLSSHTRMDHHRADDCNFAVDHTVRSGIFPCKYHYLSSFLHIFYLFNLL